MMDTTHGEAQGCSVLQDTADLSPTGELTWAADAFPLGTVPEVDAWDLSLRMGFSADGEEIAGGQLRATVDTTFISASWDDVDACAVQETHGGDPCVPCPNGSEACAMLGAYGIRLYRTADEVPDALDPCSLTWADVDTDCSGCAQVPVGKSPLLALALAGLVGMRRRQAACRRPRPSSLSPSRGRSRA